VASGAAGADAAENGCHQVIVPLSPVATPVLLVNPELTVLLEVRDPDDRSTVTGEANAAVLMASKTPAIRHTATVLFIFHFSFL
jgi:hypothetical protein